MNQPENLLNSGIEVDITAQSYLKETARWARFLAIIGFVFSSLLVLMGVFAGALFTSLSGGVMPMGGFMGAGMLSGFYVVIAIVYFILSLYLYRFATKMLAALEYTDSANFNESLRYLKSVYRIMGIIVIVYLSLLALGLIVAIIAGLTAR